MLMRTDPFRELDRVRVDPREVELHDELLTVAVGVDGHGSRPGSGAEHLLSHSVELAEWVGSHQHVHGSFLLDVRLFLSRTMSTLSTPVASRVVAGAVQCKTASRMRTREDVCQDTTREEAGDG